MSLNDNSSGHFLPKNETPLLQAKSDLKENETPNFATAFVTSGLPEGTATPKNVNDCIAWQCMRTSLANERTFLAWTRTSLTLFGFGFGILKVESYINDDNAIPWYDKMVAYLFTLGSIAAFLIGFYRFKYVNNLLHIGDTLEGGKKSMMGFITVLGIGLVAGLFREILNDALT